MRLQMDISCLLIRHSILRYHPVRESGSSIPLVHLGLRPRHFWVKVCSAFKNTASLASASTMESPRIISLSWIRGLVLIQVTSCVVTTKVLKIKLLSKFSKHYFRGSLTLFSAFVQGRSAGVSGTPKRTIVVVIS